MELVHIWHDYSVPLTLLIYYFTDHSTDHWSRSESLLFFEKKKRDYGVTKVGGGGGVNVKVLR